MPNKMLIDATHPEETRVVVLRGNRVEEFDFESANRKQLRGNIYLAKVTRVEPSLQAAFIDYGGNRHGFLAFSEIHPDYYQIPTADRQALLEDDARQHRDDEAEHERRSGRRGRGGRNRGRGAHRRDEAVRSDPLAAEEAAGIPAGENMPGDIAAQPHDEAQVGEHVEENHETPSEAHAEPHAEEHHDEPHHEAHADAEHPAGSEAPHDEHHDEHHDEPHALAESGEAAPVTELNGNGAEHPEHAEPTEEETVESVGGADAMEEMPDRAPRHRRREYKIQEVIKRRQVMLVQVVKEERGTKGAALTTYLSLAGRYSVLMPNTARGGGISRKITSAEDRGRLKEIAQELEVPEGMGVILRTAGASRTKTEVKRDFEYLLRLWETVRDLTLKSTAPKLVYEEGSLTKRSIRDLYNKDIDEIIVAGEEGYKDAKDFMRMLMPSHAKNVKLYKDAQPVFTRFGIESQLDAMFSPTVQLRSGGYIVINQAEALVAIDVNSGRATREHHIEDTALKTNTEASEEIARQLRLRDLAGLIVIDYIDMEEGRNNRNVERRLKESLKHDRARIQVGRISHFGLLEMSRQRIRTSVLESSTEKCPHCDGSGHVRSVSSVTLQLLRALEEHLLKVATHNLIVRTRSEVALYILNQKRGHLRALEDRFQLSITITADPTILGPQSYVIDRSDQVHTVEAAKAIAAQRPDTFTNAEIDEEDAAADAAAEAEAEEGEPIAIPAAADHEETSHEPERAPLTDENGEPRRRRRRGRRGGRGRGEGRGEGREGGATPAHARDDQYQGGAPSEHGMDAQSDAQSETQPGEHADMQAEPGGASGEPHENNGNATDANGDVRRRRRRGRRGGRRNRQGREGGPNPGGNSPGGDFQAGEPHAGDTHSGEMPNEASGNYPAGDFQPPPPARFEPPAPSQQFEPPASQAAEPGEAPRRRSTIREPAPFAAAAPMPPPAPAPTPIVSSSAGEEPAQPKRGWWGKRNSAENAE